MKCYSCGREIDESRFSSGLGFCPYCGQEIKPAGGVERLQFCPYCGKKLEALTNFCPHCGKKLIQEGRTEEQPTYETTVKQKLSTTAKAIRNTFGRERQVRKLYRQWAEFSNLPPEEIPSEDELRRMSTARKDKKQDSYPDA